MKTLPMKPFLILQLRPEAEASDNEYDAFLQKGGLTPEDTRRIRLDQEELPQDLDLDDYAGVIVGGGPGCVSDPNETKPAIERRIEEQILSLMPAITARDFPYMGCCYGIGILAHHLGGDVSKEKYGEDVGPVDCFLTPDGQADRLLQGLPERFAAFVGHKEAVQELPDGCVQLLSSGPCPYQMIRFGQNVYATQFHPEADGAVFALRIEIYKEKGYFDPKKADELSEKCMEAHVHVPELLLRNFVTIYGQNANS